MQIHPITQEASAFLLYQSVNFYSLSFCCASSFTPPPTGTNRLNSPERTHQDLCSHTFSLRTQEPHLSSALGTQKVFVPCSISHGPASQTGEPWACAMGTLRMVTLWVATSSLVLDPISCWSRLNLLDAPGLTYHLTLDLSWGLSLPPAPPVCGGTA